jgi:hypothetical protein
MRTTHVRVDPWLWRPHCRRKGRLLSLLVLGAACAATGFTATRQYQRGGWATTPASELVGKGSTIQPSGQRADLADPTRATRVSVVTKSSAIKPRHAGEESALALKGEDVNASTATTLATVPRSHVVVLNPGTADQKGSSQFKATVQARTRTRQSTRPADNDVSRANLTRRASGEQSSTSRRAMQSYADLRNFMLRR